MFQIIFPMPSGTDVLKIKDVMPVGWTVEEVGEGWLNVRNRMNDSWVGMIKAQPGKIAIRVLQTDPQGKAFWQAFGMMYPEFNPFDLRFGVLYCTDESGKRWELDEFPKHDPNEVLADLSHYKDESTARYVSFRLGNWHPGEDLLVDSCQKIDKNGQLIPDPENLSLFLLGNIENDSTM